MKIKSSAIRCFAIAAIMAFAFHHHSVYGQADTTAVSQPDTTVQEKSKKVDRKRRDEFIPYAGVNFSQLYISSDDLESDIGIGYHFGFNYKRGKFFYWQVGARFNNSYYDLSRTADSTDNISLMAIDVPVTGGINFLSAINRVVALRLFISADPSFAFGVGENDLDINEEDINAFIFYGQAGIGVNVAFLVVEAGYNFGFNDVLKETESKPGQVFVNLGFRF